MEYVTWNKDELLILGRICLYIIPLGTSEAVLIHLLVSLQNYFYLTDPEPLLLPLVYYGASFLTAVFTGHLADAYGRLEILKVCYVMSMLASVACCLSPTYLWVLVSQAVAGTFYPSMGLLFAYTFDSLPSNVHFWTGLLPFVRTLATVLALLVSSVINTMVNWRLFVLLIRVLPFFLICLKLMLETRPQGANISQYRPLSMTDGLEFQDNSILSENFHEVTLHSSIIILKTEYNSEVIFLSILGAIVSATVFPAQIFAARFKHEASKCVLVSTSLFDHLHCTQTTIYLMRPFRYDLVASVGPLVCLSVMVPLMKVLKHHVLIRAVVVLINLLLVVLSFNFCYFESLQLLLMVAVIGCSTFLRYLVVLYLSEVLPENCRTFGCSCVVAWERFGALISFCLGYKLLHSFLTPILFSFLVLWTFMSLLVTQIEDRDNSLLHRCSID